MIVGAPWNLDWRNENLNSAGYADHVAFGGEVAFTNLSNATAWSPYLGLQASDGVIVGYEDGIQRMTMGEARMGSVLPWPLHGQLGIQPLVDTFEIAAEAGFDVGAQLASSVFPRMVFAAPPSYSEQTDPISAIGFP